MIDFDVYRPIKGNKMLLETLSTEQTGIQKLQAVYKGFLQSTSHLKMRNTHFWMSAILTFGQSAGSAKIQANNRDKILQ